MAGIQLPGIKLCSKFEQTAWRPKMRPYTDEDIAPRGGKHKYRTATTPTTGTTPVTAATPTQSAAIRAKANPKIAARKTARAAKIATLKAQKRPTTPIGKRAPLKGPGRPDLPAYNTGIVPPAMGGSPVPRPRPSIPRGAGPDPRPMASALAGAPRRRATPLTKR